MNPGMYDRFRLTWTVKDVNSTFGTLSHSFDEWVTLPIVPPNVHTVTHFSMCSLTGIHHSAVIVGKLYKAGAPVYLGYSIFIIALDFHIAHEYIGGNSQAYEPK